MEINKLKSNHSFRIFLEASVILVLVTSFFVISKNDESASASDASLTGSTGITSGGQNFHVWIEGENQGTIEGESTILSLDREYSIMGFQYSHSLYVVTDPTSGMPMSKGIHTPVTIVIIADKSLPLLHKAFGEGEKLITVYMRFYRPNPVGDGTTQHYFTVLLENAHINSLITFQQNTYNPDSFLPFMGIEVSFVYEKITWTWEDGGIEYTDTWTERRE